MPLLVRAWAAQSPGSPALQGPQGSQTRLPPSLSLACPLHARPRSAQFTLKQLAPLFTNGLAEITHLEYIPSGNARRGAGGHLTCQHGVKVSPCSLGPRG